MHADGACAAVKCERGTPKMSPGNSTVARKVGRASPADVGSILLDFTAQHATVNFFNIFFLLCGFSGLHGYIDHVISNVTIKL